jgi:Ca-activated chloride channel homolog
MRQFRASWGIVTVTVLTWTFLSISSPTQTQLNPSQQGRGTTGGMPGGRGASVEPPIPAEDLVLLTVTVADKNGAVTGLDKNRFQLLEDGVEQKIAYFWADSRPISIGFILDGSSAVSDAMNEAIRNVGDAFLKPKTAEDEFFVIVFSDSPSMVVAYTTDAKRMPKVIPSIGEQPLYDAIYNGIDAMKEAANPRKVVLVVTAAGDNGKGQTDDQLINYAVKQPVQVYAIDMGGGVAASNTLDLLASVTGGQFIVSGDNSFVVEKFATEIARALKTQYLIGYKSTNTKMDGHRRGVKVKVRPSSEGQKLAVWTKSGYYSKKEKESKSGSTVATGK